MSIFSDYKHGALSDSEFQNAHTQMNNREYFDELDEQERIWSIEEEIAEMHEEE